MYLGAGMWESTCAHVFVCIRRSEDNLRYCFLLGTIYLLIYFLKLVWEKKLVETSKQKLSR